MPAGLISMQGPLLSGWTNFYVIVGSSAGALTGLMFVVIALMPSSSRRGMFNAARVYATPSIVHLASVLVISAVLAMPGHTRTSVRASLVGIALVLLVYMAATMVRSWRQDVYSPDLEDRIWHFLLPAVAYAGLLVSGLRVASSPGVSLHLVAVSVLVLLVVAIHNAWDSAVWGALRRAEEPDR